jgi:hypothetical protein
MTKPFKGTIDVDIRGALLPVDVEREMARD